MLREWRTTAGLTQRELALLLKRPHSFVHKSEIGERRVDAVEFIEFCMALKIDPTKAIGDVQRKLKR